MRVECVVFVLERETCYTATTSTIYGVAHHSTADVDDSLAIVICGNRVGDILFRVHELATSSEACAINLVDVAATYVDFALSEE